MPKPPPAYLAGLDPQRDYHAIYRHMVMREFPAEMRIGFGLAFYRTFAIPSIARLLHDTGQIITDTDKRGDDTRLAMYELIANGPESSRGRQIIALLNRMHRIYDITEDEYRYVLGTNVFCPTRWIDRKAHRRLHPAERAATLAFWRRVGDLMKVKDVPPTWEEFEAAFDAFEKVHLGHDPAVTPMIEAIRAMTRRRVPRPLQRFAIQAREALLDEPLRLALGVPKPPAAIRILVNGLIWTRAQTRRLTGPARKDFFTPGESSKVYPDGYTLEQLGPDPLRSVPRR